jgi:hypothetical protein
MAKIFSGKVISVAEFPSAGLLKGAFYFNTTTGTSKVAISDTELKDLNISDAFVQISGETITLSQWISNLGQDFNGLEQSVAGKVAIANIHTGKSEGDATESTKVASKAYVDQEVAAAVTGGVEGLASQDWVTGQINSAKGELNTAIGGNTTAINNHIADKNNPHQVTAEQIGAAAASALSATDAKVLALETKTAGIVVAADGKTNIDGVSVASAIASKVDQSAYDTKMAAIDESLAKKLEASDIAQLNTDVEGLKTATGNLGTELAKKADLETVNGQLATKVDQSAYNTKVEELTNAINSKEGAITVTADKALISDASGKVAASSVSAVELGYLSGVKSSVQDQIDGAVAAAGTAETNAKSHADTEIGKAKDELKAYADQSETDAIASAKSYTDEQVIAVKAYADQSETDAIAAAKSYTDTEVQALEGRIAAIEHFEVVTTDSLEAVTKPKPKTIYLVPIEGRQSAKAEYLYVDGNWEMIGTTDVDLSLYSTTDQMTSAISSAAGTAKSEAITTANGYTDGQVAAAKEELQGSINTLSGTVESNKTAAENAIAAVELKFSNGELVEGSKTLSVGTWKFVSADRSKAVIYEVVDAAANTVYVEVLRGSDFVTLAGLNASAEGSFYVYYLG